MTTYQETVSKAQLTSAEHEVLADVAEHVSYYLANRRELSSTLGGYVVHKLIEEGDIEGHSLGGVDTLEQYSSDLASAVAKIEAALPEFNPLAPVDDVQID